MTPRECSATVVMSTFGNVVDADGRDGADGRHGAGEIGEPAAIQHMVGGESDDLAGRAIDADARAHLEGVTLDAALKLLIAVVREPDRAAGKEHRRQRDIERERRMVAAAESAAHIGEEGVDTRRLERGAGFAEHKGKRLRGLVRRLHAEHELEVFGARIVPAEPAFRLEKHRIDGLRLEFAVEHQTGRDCRAASSARICSPWTAALA